MVGNYFRTAVLGALMFAVATPVYAQDAGDIVVRAGVARTKLVDKGDIPLIIDQPEGNLDNETIVDLLVPCIREAKKRRQIIIVTHNPNLAVVCDADQIIWATLDKSHDYRLNYECGALENPVINKKVVDILEGTQPAFDNRDSKYQRQVG